MSRRAAASMYRLLLRLLPAELRDAYGDDMEQLYLAEIEAARHRGHFATLATTLSGLRDVISRAPYEHWRWSANPSSKEQTMSSVLSDLRFAFRSFARQKGATVLVLLTLTLAVAATTAVFALLNALFFRSFPMPHAERLVYINERAPKWNLEFTGIDVKDFAIWQRNANVFESMALYDQTSVNLAEGDRTDRVDGMFVTYEFPNVTGFKPILGRSFTAQEDVPKGPRVVMIGNALWQSRFGGARDVIGKTLRINSRPYTIVGVLPKAAEWPSAVQFWLPMQEDPNHEGNSYSYDGIGRLKPSVSIEQARADLDRTHAPIWRERDSVHVVSPRLDGLRERFVADFTVMGKALGASVALVLLIACANVAGAMLARAIFRQREIGIRMALGASVRRVGRQMLTESLLLASIAGVVGTLLGWWGLTLLVASAPGQLPGWAQVGLDWRMIGFSLLVVVATALMFGIVPAVQLRRQDVRGSLAATNTRIGGSFAQRRALDALVVFEIALAAVLLATSGLLIQAYGNMRGVDPGFRTQGMAVFRVALPAVKYPNGLAQRRFFETLESKLRILPGVDGAGAVSCPPLTCHWGNFPMAEGEVIAPNAPNPVTNVRLASAGYFDVMQSRRVAGRIFGPNEGSPKGAHPIVVNAMFAKQHWPGVADPSGRRVHWNGDTVQANWFTVVGVVKEDRHYGLAAPARPSIFLPLTSIDSAQSFGSFGFLVHTNGDPEMLFPSIRAVLRELDPELPLYGVGTLEGTMASSLATRRTLATALGAFAAIALTLALGGIYAVLSYLVGRRRREIGIRVALGAQRSQVLGLVVRQGLTLVAVGVVIGLPLAYLAARVVASLLVGVSARDPLTYIGVVLSLAITGTLAALVPARRAAKVEPTVALVEG